MNKKIFALIFAAIMIVSLTATALAAPDETAAPSASPTESVEPSGSPAPADTAAPTVSPAPTSVEDAAFVEQVKAMSAQVVDLSAKLKAEKRLDQKLRSQIASLKGVYTPNPRQDKAYKAEIAPLEKQLKKLDQDLAKLKRDLDKASNGKHKNQAKIDELNQQITKVTTDIANVQAKIVSVNAKYADLLKHQRANNSARKTLSSFRRQLKAEYAKLTPYIHDSQKMSAELHSLVGQLKDAIEAGDIVKATDALAKITEKVQQLTDNINQRIAIRTSISKMIEDYKANLEKA